MVFQEIRNIDKLKDNKRKAEEAVVPINPVSWDIESESFQIPDFDYSSLDFSLNMVAPVSGFSGSISSVNDKIIRVSIGSSLGS